MASESQRGTLTMLTEKFFWLEMGRRLKRVHKDRRARKQVFRLLFPLLILLLLIAYLAFLIGSGAWLFLPIVVPVLWFRATQAKRDAEPMHIAPAPDLPAELRPETLAALRKHFAELGLVYAVLLDRSGSEQFLKEQALPESMEITSRRVHINLLKHHALWERMAAADRDAIMLPDGHWTAEMVNRITTGIEPLRLLRWLVRLDFRLPQVGQHLYGDRSIAHELVMDPGLLLNGSALADIDLIRIARDDAALFRARCVAEAVCRGYAGVQDENTMRWAEQVSRNLRGKQSEDLVLGDKLVSESDRSQLEWAGLLATVRSGFLDEVIGILENGRVPAPPVSTIFARNEAASAAGPAA